MDQHDYHEALKNAAKTMVRVKNPRRLLKMMVRFIAKEVRLTHATILIYDEVRARYILVDSKGTFRIPIKLVKLDDSNPLIRWFSRKDSKLKIKKDYLDRSTLNSWVGDPEFLSKHGDPTTLKPKLMQLEEVMVRLKAAVCIPGHYARDLLGVLLLGEKISKEAFTRSEFAFFQTLANDAAMTLKTAAYENDLISKNKQLEHQKKELEKHVKEIEVLRKKEQDTYYEIVVSLGSASWNYDRRGNGL
jgi:transcriptional regulator with GAF, ATPase, and Fis domain